MNAKRRKQKRKDPHSKRDLDLGVLVDWMLNACFCLIAGAIACFVFGYFGWGIALLAVVGIVLLLIVAGGFGISYIWAKIIRNIPHR